MPDRKRIEFWFNPETEQLCFRDGCVYKVSAAAVFERTAGKEPGEKLEFVLVEPPGAHAAPELGALVRELVARWRAGELDGSSGMHRLWEALEPGVPNNDQAGPEPAEGDQNERIR